MSKLKGREAVSLTGVERTFSEDEFIVSKTDSRGIITYVNEVFLKVAGYTEEEVIGKPHNIIRHPDMPKCAFKFVWDTIKSGKEIFAYVINLAKNGDHYWVLAHLTPTFDKDGKIVGYHSNRRKPKKEAVAIVAGLYKVLCEEEAMHSNSADAMAAGTQILLNVLEEKGVGYDEFILSI